MKGDTQEGVRLHLWSKTELGPIHCAFSASAIKLEKDYAMVRSLLVLYFPLNRLT